MGRIVARTGHGGFHTRKHTRQGETVAPERTRERERKGWNLGRPAPRAPRKLGQVFCTCRSNAGTFAAVFIILPFLFALPALLSSLLHSPLQRKLEKTVPETSLWETNDLKLRTTTILVIFFFFKWNVSIGSHDSPRYTIFSRVIRTLSRVCVGNAGFNRVKRDSRSVTSEFLDVSLGWDITVI